MKKYCREIVSNFLENSELSSGDKKTLPAVGKTTADMAAKMDGKKQGKPLVCAHKRNKKLHKTGRLCR